MATMENWRSTLGLEARQKIVGRIMETLQKHMPSTAADGRNELMKIAWRFEEKIFQSATDQQDYLRRISVKMLSLENRSQTNPSNGGAGDGKPSMSSSSVMMQQGQAGISQQQQQQVPANQQQQPSQQSQQQQVQQQQGQQQPHQPVTATQQQQQQQQQLQARNQAMQAQRQQQMLGQGGNAMSGMPPLVNSNQGQQGTLPGILPQGQPGGFSGIISHQNPLANPNMLLNSRMMQARQQQAGAPQQHFLQSQQLKQKLMQQRQHQQSNVLNLQQQSNMLQQQNQQMQQQQPPQNAMKQQMQQGLVQPMQQGNMFQQSQQMHHVGGHPQQQQQQQQLSTLQQSNALQHQANVMQPPYMQQMPHPQQLMPQQQFLQSGKPLNQSAAGASQHDQQKQQLVQQQQVSTGDSGAPGQASDPAQEIVWTKLQALREKYLVDMNNLFSMLQERSKQVCQPDHLQKLNHYKEILNRMIPYLTASRTSLPKEFKQDKVEAFEKQIVTIMDTFKRRKPQQQPQQQQQQQQHQQQQQQQPQQYQQQLQAQQHSNQHGQPTPQASSVTSLQQQSTAPTMTSALNALHGPLQQQPGLTSLQMLQQRQQRVQQFNKLQPQIQMPPQMQEDSKADVKRPFLQQQQQNVLKRQLLQPAHMKVGSPQLVSSPQTTVQAPSPQISQQLSPQPEQQSFTPIPKAGTPMQATTPPFMSPSPMLSGASPPIEDIENRATPSAMSSLTASANQAPVIGTPGISASPFLDFSPSPAQIGGVQDGGAPGTPYGDKTTDPVDRLVRFATTMSAAALHLAVQDMKSVTSLTDMLAASAPGPGCKAAVGEDLSAVTSCRMHARVLANEGGNPKKKRRLESTPLSLIAWDGTVVNSLHKSEDSEVTSPFKQKLEMSYSLEEEIREVNDNLIDTVVSISGEGTEEADAEGKEGMMVTVSYNGIEITGSQSTQDGMYIISPLRLLVPPNYPRSPPIVLPGQGPNSNHVLSVTARERFNRAMRGLSQPLTVNSMAWAWDECVRQTVAEAEHPGGPRPSVFGVWVDCVYS